MNDEAPSAVGLRRFRIRCARSVQTGECDGGARQQKAGRVVIHLADNHRFPGDHDHGAGGGAALIAAEIRRARFNVKN